MYEYWDHKEYRYDEATGNSLDIIELHYTFFDLSNSDVHSNFAIIEHIAVGSKVTIREIDSEFITLV